MRYFVTLDPKDPEKTHEVDVTELPQGGLEVLLGGKKVSVDATRLGASWSVRVEGSLVDIAVEGTAPDLGIVGSGMRSYARVESARMRQASAAKSRGGDLREKVVKSPMPGRVVKIATQVGAEISPGDPLLVVEAMKMENEIFSKAPGVVKEIFVTVGASVEGGAPLLSLE